MAPVALCHIWLPFEGQASNGQIKAKGSPEAVLTKKNIADVFGVDCEVLDKTDTDPLRIFIREAIVAEKKEVNNDKELKRNTKAPAP